MYIRYNKERDIVGLKQKIYAINVYDYIFNIV